MILIDANLLVYAHVATLSQHEPAREWLDGRLNGVAPVGIPWPSLLSFVRLVTNPRIFKQPTNIANAWNQVEEWLDCRPAWIPMPTDQHRKVLASLLKNQKLSANLVPDAHLAALAIEHGLILCSSDGDFARFADLRWEDPLRRET